MQKQCGQNLVFDKGGNMQSSEAMEDLKKYIFILNNLNSEQVEEVN